MHIFLQIVTVIAFPFLFVVFLLLSLPIYAYRVIVTKLVSLVYSGSIGKAVTATGATLIGADLTKESVVKNRPSKGGIVTCIVIEGSVSLIKVKEAVQTKWIEKRGVNKSDVEQASGPLCYPEFQQYVGSWLGFMFWKWDTDFDIDNHFHKHSIDEKASEEECEKFLDTLKEELLNKPFPPKRSPWEVHVVESYKNSQLSELRLSEKSDENKNLMSVLLFRTHHCLGDGYTISNLLIEDLFGLNIENAQVAKPVSNKPKTRTGVQLWKHFLSGALGLLNFIRNSLFYGNGMPFRVSREQKRDSRLLLCTSKSIPIDNIKRTAKSFEVPFTQVLISSLSAALAKQKKKFCGENGCDRVKSLFVLPRRNHSKKLRNNLTAGDLDLPISLSLSPIQRLNETSHSLKQLKSSVLPLIAPLYFMITGNQLKPIVRHAAMNRYFPVLITNVPGPGVPCLCNGAECLSVDFSIGILEGVTGVGFMILSYNNFIRISVVAESCLMTRKELTTLLGHVTEEINNLHELAESYQKPITMEVNVTEEVEESA